MHAGIALYIVLNQLKLISDNNLNNYYTNVSNLSGHVSHYDVPGIFFSTGFLEHGFPDKDGRANTRINNSEVPIVVLTGDGEMN